MTYTGAPWDDVMRSPFIHPDKLAVRRSHGAMDSLPGVPPPTLRDLEFIVVFSQVPECAPLMLADAYGVCTNTCMSPSLCN